MYRKKSHGPVVIIINMNGKSFVTLFPGHLTFIIYFGLPICASSSRGTWNL